MPSINIWNVEETKAWDICLEKQPDDTFNVCTGTLLSVNQIVKYVTEVMGISITPIYQEASKLWDTYPDLFFGSYPLNKEIVAKEVNKYSKGSYQKSKNLLNFFAICVFSGIFVTIFYSILCARMWKIFLIRF